MRAVDDEDAVKELCLSLVSLSPSDQNRRFYSLSQMQRIVGGGVLPHQAKYLQPRVLGSLGGGQPYDQQQILITISTVA